MWAIVLEWGPARGKGHWCTGRTLTEEPNTKRKGMIARVGFQESRMVGFYEIALAEGNERVACMEAGFTVEEGKTTLESWQIRTTNEPHTHPMV